MVRPLFSPADTGERVHCFAAWREPVIDLVFSPDSKQIACRHADHLVSILDIEHLEARMNIVALPGNERLVWRPDNLYYWSSAKGDRYGALRFGNDSHQVYPLEDFRKTLRVPDWMERAKGPAPQIAP